MKTLRILPQTRHVRKSQKVNYKKKFILYTDVLQSVCPKFVCYFDSGHVTNRIWMNT